MNDNYYVTNEDILPEMAKWKDTGKASEKLGRIFLLIASNLAQKRCFSGYTWKEDMIQEAVLTCMKYGRSFNTDKSQDPFSYITTICRNAFLNYIKKQKKHSEIKDVCFKNKDFFEQEGYVEKATDYTLLFRE